MTDPTGDNPQEKINFSLPSLPVAAVLAGVVLILFSLLPWDNFWKESLWTMEDSQAFEKIAAEYHKISYQTPERAGVSEEQLKAQIEKAKAQLDTLQTKLQSARQRPLVWKRILLWAGVLLTTCGCVGQYASGRP